MDPKKYLSIMKQVFYMQILNASAKTSICIHIVVPDSLSYDIPLIFKDGNVGTEDRASSAFLVADSVTPTPNDII